MPLSEKLRIDAGRSFSHTLFARSIVALLFLLFTMVITAKSSKAHPDFMFMGDQTTKTVVVTSNDTYGR